MKNYGLQVKEIPIVFRGSVDAATPGESGYNYDTALFHKSVIPETSGSSHIYTAYVNFELEIAETTKLYIKCDDYFAQVTPYYAKNDLLKYGESDRLGPIFTDYPFHLKYDVDGNYDDQALLELRFPDDETRDFAIWVEDPVINLDPVPGHKVFTADITGNGQINRFYARFACGENGTLHLRPYVILNGNIRVDLCNFAQGGDQYIAGDNEEIEFDCYVPVETHAVAYVEAENTGEYPSLVDAAMTVQYEDFIESESIVGYEGVNLRRGRR